MNTTTSGPMRQLTCVLSAPWSCAGRSLAAGVRARFLESVLRQDSAWHETGAGRPGHGWRAARRLCMGGMQWCFHDQQQPTLLHSQSLAAFSVAAAATAAGSMGAVIRGLNEDTASFQDAVGDRMGNFCRNLSTTVAALVVCEPHAWEGHDLRMRDFFFSFLRQITCSSSMHMLSTSTPLRPPPPPAAFIRGWELTAVMTATMPALVAVSVACSVASKKLQARGGRGSRAAGCGRACRRL